VGRINNGTVVGWGDPEFDLPAPPQGVAYVEVAAGYSYTAARRSDGIVVARAGPRFFEAPPLAPGMAYTLVAPGYPLSVGEWFPPPQDGRLQFAALFGPATPPNAPDITVVGPDPIDALMPGTEKAVSIYGVALDLGTALLLDGVPIDPARYELLSSTMIQLDMPQVSTLGVHDLAITDGSVTEHHPVRIAAPAVPRYELGTGDPMNVIDRDDGLTLLLGGQPGHAHRIYVSLSDVPSVHPRLRLDIGNQFTELIVGGQYVIPESGWLQLSFPPSTLPDPGVTGTAFYSQNIDLPLPLEVSNLQSILMVQ